MTKGDTKGSDVTQEGDTTEDNVTQEGDTTGGR